MNTTDSLPINDSLIASLAQGYLQTQGENNVGENENKIPVNPAIKTIGDYLDSLGNSKLTAKRDDLEKAIREVIDGKPQMAMAS